MAAREGLKEMLYLKYSGLQAFHFYAWISGIFMPSGIFIATARDQLVSE